MAEHESYDDGWWKIRSWIASNENFRDDKPLDPNMCNESQVKQLDVGITPTANVNQIVSSHSGGKEIDDGDVQKRNGKGIKVQKRKRIDLAKRVLVERRRRNEEAKLYQELLALLPNLTIKDDRAKILQEAENCIKSMEETLRGLEKQKQERLHIASQSLIANNTQESPNLLINKGASINLDQSSISFKSSNVTLNVCGADAVINICSQRIPDLFTSICYIFEEHNMEVVYTKISSDHVNTMYLIRVRANVPPQIEKGFPYEEVYNKAWVHIVKLVTLQN